METKKFYEFKNQVNNNSLDIMLYGEIISGGQDSKWDSTDVCFQDFQNALSQIGVAGSTINTVNIYINSIGGSVFTTQGIVAMLQRVKDKGITINSYIDGIGASCASFLPMISDNIYAYSSSLLMIHKPMNIAIGNADDFQEQIDLLDKVEDSVMMPLYMSKAKDGVTEEQIKDLLSAETWLNAEEMSELFNITILEESKDLVACIDNKAILNKYKNIPSDLKNKLVNSNLNIKDDLNNEDNQSCVCTNCNHSDNCQSTGSKCCICVNCPMVEICSKVGADGCKCSNCSMAQNNCCQPNSDNCMCNECTNMDCKKGKMATDTQSNMDMQNNNDLELAIAKLRIKLL